VPQQETMTFDLEIARIEKKVKMLFNQEFESFRQKKKNKKIKRIGACHASKEKQENIVLTLVEQAFEKSVIDMPIYNCLVCSCTFFRKDVVQNKQMDIQNLDIEIGKIKSKNCRYDIVEN
jgi:hypothetical protein